MSIICSCFDQPFKREILFFRALLTAIAFPSHRQSINSSVPCGSIASNRNNPSKSDNQFRPLRAISSILGSVDLYSGVRYPTDLSIDPRRHHCLLRRYSKFHRISPVRSREIIEQVLHLQCNTQNPNCYPTSLSVVSRALIGILPPYFIILSVGVPSDRFTSIIDYLHHQEKPQPIKQSEP